MCYGMGCRYERQGGADAGECTINGNCYPDDAVCKEQERREMEDEDE